MSDFKIISTLRYLNISEEVESNFELMPGIYVLTDKDHIKDILDDEFQDIAGIIESDHFLNANHILYCETDDSIFRKCDSHQALMVWLSWLDMVLRDSWLIKDHSIACETAYCKKTEGERVQWTSNNLMVSSSFSSGVKFKDTSFSLEELGLWKEKSYKLQDYLHQKNSSIYDSFVDKNFSRIGRALRFINSARIALHPAIKISHYCSALESLFSTDSCELSHKLSERVALFLKEFNYSPSLIFDEVKSYYNIRSKVTHGDSLQNKKAENLPELSEGCDTLLRNIMNIIIDTPELIEIFDGTKESFENHFKTKLFGE